MFLLMDFYAVMPSSKRTGRGSAWSAYEPTAFCFATNMYFELFLFFYPYIISCHEGCCVTMAHNNVPSTCLLKEKNRVIKVYMVSILQYIAKKRSNSQRFNRKVQIYFFYGVRAHTGESNLA